MAISTKVSTAGRILAIDLGKYKSVACRYDPGSGEVQFSSLETTREELRRRLITSRPPVVVIEACALSGWVSDLCAELGVPCRVANTSSEAWKFKHSKRKTDRDDALRLAQLQALNQLPVVVIPPKPIREWRSLIAHRQALVGRRVTLQNRIRSILLVQGVPAPRGASAWASAGLTEFTALAKPLVDCSPEELWRGRLDRSLVEYGQVLDQIKSIESTLDALGRQSRSVQLLLTIPGVGPRTAEAVARKLLVRCWAVLRDGVPWREPPLA